MKLFFITRSQPKHSGTGGEMVRKQTIDLLVDNDIDVVTITPNYNSLIPKFKNNSIEIPYPKVFIKLMLVLEKFGLVKDYMSPWAYIVFLIIKSKVKEEDTVLATSGGEMGCAILGQLLKKATGCRFVLNLHDPFNNTTIEGKRIITKRKFCIRDKHEKELFECCDRIYTSSDTYCVALKNKYPYLADDFSNWYFGYTEDYRSFSLDLRVGTVSEKIRLVYAGNMNNKQSPANLIQLLSKYDFFEEIEFHFFGSGTDSNVLVEYSKNLSNVYYHGMVDKKTLSHFCLSSADIAYMPLHGSYYKYFVPSKFYDYISFALPVLAYVSPGSNSEDIIVNKGYGFSVNNEAQMVEVFSSILRNRNILYEAKSNVLRDRKSWFMGNTAKAFVKYLVESR
ncbi:hypothetical protein KW463_16270 [Vibrio fluvialis]|nr:hypothetical protein [Vibrio fluvialis]